MKFKINEIVLNAKEVKSLFGKAKGLMFSKKQNLIFVFNREEIIPLHMFFVFFPIIVLFANKDKKIVEKSILNPFTTYTPKNRAKYVIEISTIRDLKRLYRTIKIGTQLKFF